MQFLNALFFLSTVASLVQCKKLHEYMTKDEVMTIFHTKHDSIPEYDVVPVRHKRNINFNKPTSIEMEVAAANKQLKLYLNPTEGVFISEKTPLWTITSDPQSPEGVRYYQVIDPMRSLFVNFQDPIKMAAVTAIPTASGYVLFDGTIGPNTVIRSLPERIIQDVAYGPNGLYEPHFAKNVTDENDLVHTYHHVVYKMPDLKGKQYEDFNITIPEELMVEVRKKRATPDVIYPEVLVVVDYHEYSLIGRNLEQAKRYLISFWNGVDLRYRLLTHPRIRFNVAGIVIALDANAVPYIEKNRVNTNSVDADLALRQMGSYFYRETRFPEKFYDLVVTLTQLDLCNFDSDECDGATLGYAFVAGACDRNDEKKMSEAVAVVEDNGGYSGIIPTAHEVGHLIGAHHDGSKTAKDCPARNGFIMTGGLLLHQNGFEWSSCSINAFYKFLNEDRAKCLYNEPKKGLQVPRYLPGKLMSLDHQCQRSFGLGACNRDASVCTRLECKFSGFRSMCRAIAPAAEGSRCGNDLFCLNGRCVLEGAVTKVQGVKSFQQFVGKLQVIEHID